MINEAAQPGPSLAAGESAASCLIPFPSPQSGKPGLTRVWLMALLGHALSLMPYIFHTRVDWSS